MKCASRSGAIKVSSVLLVAGAMAGGLLAGAGFGTAAAADTLGVAAAAPCKSGQVTADSAHPTGSTQVLITVTNQGSKACVLNGFPTVAVAGQGSPDKNRPLQVTRQGAARPVQLAPGGHAAARLTFTPVLGEADGYCTSGADPTVAPSMVVGVAGARYQLAPDDGGNFALCGNSVRATAFRAAGS
ncbi:MULTISPECIES: DUF4232 domain-containing protein [unclassified Streptomyces]|uniref:DUF4232 domain-containing protein n=1 Tax=unclassified Streptomyces TaxID=2593676 RepID=UPI0022523F94|nr:MULTISPECIES: DUF4232 domain-containing protein [unclassified Streptomyces]MCX5149701.1 DUF4232 domain-containing protein [Streptomyces sp. NBC_00320]WSN52740.1 DUF4232 domain-containing protein [Streptomyces sp. NBC_01296]WSW57751.1 DUF4232 domain-containing protein [Streptomyces sp. NBC_00998]